jgi:endonuclease IV
MIGVHVAKVSHVLEGDLNVRATMLEAIKTEVDELKLKTVQIYTHGPRNSRANNMDHKAISKYCSDNKINLFVHSAYITTGIWNIAENKTSPKSKASIKLLMEQLAICDILKSQGLVIHLPKKHWSFIVDVFKILESELVKYKTPILLEMTAVKPHPTNTYESAEKNNRLCEAMSVLAYDNWGLCVDTAHLWGAGVAIDEVDIMREWLTTLKNPKKVKLLHLNGASINTWDTGKDKHMVIFSPADDIWSDATVTRSGLKYNDKKIRKSSIYDLLKFVKKHKINIICEVNRGSESDVRFAIKAIQTTIDLKR